MNNAPPQGGEARSTQLSGQLLDNMTNSLTAGNLFIILAAGILPAVFWLWFWLREDIGRPEPRSWIILSFLVGAAAVIPTYFLENFAAGLLSAGLALIIAWSAIEEIIKYLGAWLADFHIKAFDEPEDAMIYLITVALGFASTENILFLIKSFSGGGLELSLITALMRFLGATLLHVLASATLGGFIGLAYCAPGKLTKVIHTCIGLAMAIVLHALFNYFIIRTEAGNTIFVFAGLWLAIIGLLIFFERVKKIVCDIRPELRLRL